MAAGNDDDDDEVLVVDAPRDSSMGLGRDSLSSSKRCSTGSSGSGAADEEDIEMVGRTGCNSLGDFPHPRYICPTYTFVKGKHASHNTPHCAKCFCYVCDSVGECAILFVLQFTWNVDSLPPICCWVALLLSVCPIDYSQTKSLANLTPSSFSPDSILALTLVEECESWHAHCGAWNGEHWTVMRAIKKRNGTVPPHLAAAAASSGSSFGSSSASSSSASHARPWSSSPSSSDPARRDSTAAVMSARLPPELPTVASRGPCLDCSSTRMAASLPLFSTSPASSSSSAHHRVLGTATIDFYVAHQISTAARTEKILGRITERRHRQECLSLTSASTLPQVLFHASYYWITPRVPHYRTGEQVKVLGKDGQPESSEAKILSSASNSRGEWEYKV